MFNPNVSYNQLIKNLKKDTSQFSRFTVAILADFACQHLAKALRAAAIDHRIVLDVWEAEYDTIERNIFDEDSELYTKEYHYILVFNSSLKLYKEYSRESFKDEFAQKKINSISNIISILQERTKSIIIVSNFVEIDDAVFGNYANKTKLSFLYQVRKLNFDLMNLAINQKNFFISDVQALNNTQGLYNSFDPKLYIHADIVYSLDFIVLIAQNTLKTVASLAGNFKKCIILDLDNTLWGGVIGDDGMENIQIGDLGLGKAFTNLQIWLRNLRQRGIILAVCSKNTEEIAKEPFEKHPSMILRLEDIAVFIANWETKVDNILFIQSILNVGFDSMVFIDDNPFERTIIKQHIPDITVPDLPEDPSEYLFYLQSLNLFETTSLSIEDANRTKQYQDEASRAVLQKKFTSEAEFLESLDMKAIIEPINTFTRPRVAQLTQRSNQFNLRTIRYTEEDIDRLMSDLQKFTLTVSLKDHFGDYGLISAVILEKKAAHNLLFIDTWIMSCRVLKRGVEDFLLNEIVCLAKKANVRFVEGEYIPTSKNAIVKNHYYQLGFQQGQDNKRWILDLKSYKPKRTFITKTNTYVFNR